MTATDIVDETDDPFEAFNKAMGAGVVTDPYPDFVELRRQGPLVEVDFGPGMASGMPRLFQAVSYEAVQEILRDGRRFSSAGYAEVMGAVMGHTILETYPGAAQDLWGIPRQRNLAGLRRGLRRFASFEGRGISCHELDAITCALLAQMHHRGLTELIGREDEGWMVLPRTF